MGRALKLTHTVRSRAPFSGIAMSMIASLFLAFGDDFKTLRMLRLFVNYPASELAILPLIKRNAREFVTRTFQRVQGHEARKLLCYPHFREPGQSVLR